MTAILPVPHEVQMALNRLKSLGEGDLGVLDVVACGGRAVAPLRDFLFKREPSGLFQPRCRAVEALKRLGAYDVLIEFLELSREIADPVERLGEEAVISAAARALAGLGDDRVFNLLLSLADIRLLPGVVAALGASGRPEAISYLIAALAEGECRPAAESALRRVGASAVPSLLVASTRRPGAPESDSRLRQRRGALRLLAEIGIPTESWAVLRHLMRDEDAKVAALACELCLSTAPEPEKPKSIRRLIDLLANGDWALAAEIEQCLALNFDLGRDLILEALGREEAASGHGAAASAKARALRRIMRQVQTAPRRSS